MQWYAVGILREVRMGPPIREYLEQIDATLAPFGGRFIVHGGDREILEGELGQHGVPGRRGRPHPPGHRRA